jgi:hypothetical protein
MKDFIMYTLVGLITVLMVITLFVLLKWVGETVTGHYVALAILGICVCYAIGRAVVSSIE